MNSAIGLKSAKTINRTIQPTPKAQAKSGIRGSGRPGRAFFSATAQRAAISSHAPHHCRRLLETASRIVVEIGRATPRLLYLSSKFGITKTSRYKRMATAIARLTTGGMSPLRRRGGGGEPSGFGVAGKSAQSFHQRHHRQEQCDDDKPDDNTKAQNHDEIRDSGQRPARTDFFQR